MYMDRSSSQRKMDTSENQLHKKSLGPGMSWREWKKQRKERQRWRDQKVLKKLSKKLKVEDVEHPKKKAVQSCYTVSIAVPGSILDNAQTPNLKAHLVANIARSAAIFRVNEIVVYSDSNLDELEDIEQSLKLHQKYRGCLQMVRILKYLECPPYLRKKCFPIHKDLENAGQIHPLQLPSHLGVDDESEYREGIVSNKPVKRGRGSYVEIGLKRLALIDESLIENVRVTVQLDKEQNSKKHYKGKVVSPNAPLEYDNIYWGYSIRLAKNITDVFSECPYSGGYDITIGTSDKGQNVDHIELPRFKHLLIAFGGLNGIEACLEDERVLVNDPKELFNYYLNVCPLQGTKSIRTEEAILATLATLRPKIFQSQSLKP